MKATYIAYCCIGVLAAFDVLLLLQNGKLKAEIRTYLRNSRSMFFNREWRMTFEVSTHIPDLGACFLTRSMKMGLRSSLHR